MAQIISWNFLIAFLSSVLGFVVAGILVFVRKTETFPSRLLAAFLVCISLLALNFALMAMGFFLEFPQAWRTLGWASFSFQPMAFLYVRASLEQSYRFRRSDFLFFIPAVLQQLSLLPYYLLSLEDKHRYMEMVVQNPKLIMSQPEGILPENGLLWVRILMGVAFTIGQFILLARWKRRQATGLNQDPQNAQMIQWLSRFTIVNAIFWGLIIPETILHSAGSSQLNWLTIMTIATMILFVTFYLLVRPSILYGIVGWGKSEPGDTSDATGNISLPEKPERRHVLTPEQGQSFKRSIEEHFMLKKPYLKPGYTIGNLASELEIPSYQLSTFINQEYGKNFNELINQFRVNHLVEQFRQGSVFSQFTLEALGKDVGFNSRAAFISAFKKTTGRTPSEYFGRRSEKTIL